MFTTEDMSIVKNGLIDLFNNNDNWFQYKNNKLCIIFEDCIEWKEIIEELGYCTDVTSNNDVIVYYNLLFDWYDIDSDL